MLYADDTIIYTTSNNIHQIQTKLQSIVDKTTEWTNMNKLTVNVDKTKSIVFHRKHARPKMDILINNKPLEQITEYKYLGYRLDERLDFKPLLQETIKSVRHKIYLFNKVRSCITQKTAPIIYKSKILPYIDYGDVLYNEVDQTQTKKLQTLQNRAIRIAHRLSNRTNVDEKHITHKLLHVENRRIVHLLTYMHSIRDTSNLIDTRSLSTRQHDGRVFQLVFPKSTWFKKSFLYQGIKKWNQLPNDFRCIDDPNSFKSRVKRKLLEEETTLYA